MKNHSLDHTPKEKGWINEQGIPLPKWSINLELKINPETQAATGEWVWKIVTPKGVFSCESQILPEFMSRRYPSPFKALSAAMIFVRQHNEINDFFNGRN